MKGTEGARAQLEDEMYVEMDDGMKAFEPEERKCI